MTDTAEIRAGTPVDEMKIVVNSLHLSLAFLLDRIEAIGGKAAAAEARDDLIASLKSGDVDMAIMEDRDLFDFVLSVVERLPAGR